MPFFEVVERRACNHLPAVAVTLSISAKLLGCTSYQKSIAYKPCSDKSSKSQEPPLYQANGYTRIGFLVADKRIDCIPGRFYLQN